MKKIINRVLVLSVLLFVIQFYIKNHPLESAPSTSVKDVLSSSQLSYFARIGTGTTALDTIIEVSNSGNPSINTNNLFVGDTIGIGRSSGLGIDSYVVRDIGNTAIFQINSALAVNNAKVGNMIIATRSAIHTIYFTPKSSVAGGAWQFLIKATSRTGENHQDGIPDQQGFDLGSTIPSGAATGLGTRLQAADISCPFGTASVGTTAVVNSNSYHVVTCTLGAGITNPIDVGVTMVIGRELASGSQLINPSAALNHTEGQADTTADVYTFMLRHLDSSSVLLDSDTTTGKIAVVESVRVTATVDPTITFYIDNIGVSAPSMSLCGTTLATTADNTTSTSVSFGSLNLNAFNNLAQRLSCITNADGGYSVTVYETGVMKNINSGTTIPDTNCDGGCNTTTAAAWATDVGANGSEWGYTMQNTSVGVTIFNYQSGWKAFGIGAANAKEIMKNTNTPGSIEQAYICYRVTASTIQEAGNYENHLVYTATATF
ncbi:MAG: hypothetical protein Q8P53_01185 [Candidatus Shapirobacteria bacterium]|nr:hypothetical protein [Candidatus Shapirobacteria bacterium]